MIRHSRPLPVVFDARVITGSGGGPDKTILNSPRFLEPLGYRMLCGYLTPPGDPGFADIERKAAKYGAPLFAVADRGPTDWRIVPKLLKICREENVAIWHGHDYKTNAFGLLLKQFWPMRLVTTLHGWVKQTSRTPMYYRIDRLCLPPVEPLEPEQIQQIREASHVSQAVFARLLNTSLSTVQKWEIGQKKPTGTALKLLHLVQKRGLEVVA